MSPGYCAGSGVFCLQKRSLITVTRRGQRAISGAGSGPLTHFVSRRTRGPSRPYLLAIVWRYAFITLFYYNTADHFVFICLRRPILDHISRRMLLQNPEKFKNIWNIFISFSSWWKKCTVNATFISWNHSVKYEIVYVYTRIFLHLLFLQMFVSVCVPEIN